MSGPHHITTDFGRLHLTDSGGASAPVLALHGFPDDSHIYDRLTEQLAPRRTLALDFGGFGQSARDDADTVAPGRREAEVEAAVQALDLEPMILIGHDASGPVAINFTLRHPEQVKRLVLLNTYYGSDPALRFPELIRLLYDPALVPLADAMMTDPAQRAWLLNHTRAQFGYPIDDPEGVAAQSVIPQFFGTRDQPDSLRAIRAWTRNLQEELRQQDRTIASGALRASPVPVSVVFGADDPYLNSTVAAHLAAYFRNSSLHLINGASHWPQWDRPNQVAEIIDASGTREQ